MRNLRTYLREMIGDKGGTPRRNSPGRRSAGPVSSFHLYRAAATLHAPGHAPYKESMAEVAAWVAPYLQASTSVRDGVKKRLYGGLTMQPYILGYSSAISLVSPTLTGYQLCKVYSCPVGMPRLMRIGFGILPQQTALKTLQMNAATPVKEHVSPWLAFGVIGVLQGGVYGQANVAFSRALKLSQNANLAGMFRGAAFAGLRDTISQGVPFMLSGSFQRAVVDPILGPSKAREAHEGAIAEHDEGYGSALRKTIALVTTSIGATFASQGAHNCQILMQADHSLGYSGAMSTLWAQHGSRMFYMGGSARVALLLVVNGLNEVILKKAWEANKEQR